MLNVSSCIKGNLRSTGGGGIIRDHKGEMIKDFTKYYEHWSNNVVKIYVILKGIKMRFKYRLLNVVIESEFLLIINILNNY